MNTTFPELLESYMNEKRMDDLSLAHNRPFSDDGAPGLLIYSRWSDAYHLYASAKSPAFSLVRPASKDLSKKSFSNGIL